MRASSMIMQLLDLIREEGDVNLVFEGFLDSGGMGYDGEVVGVKLGFHGKPAHRLSREDDWVVSFEGDQEDDRWDPWMDDRL